MSKKYTYAFIAILVLLTAGCAQKSGKVYPYPFETAKIEFKLAGSVNGERTMYIKGDNSVSETHVTEQVDTQEKAANLEFLILGDSYYQIDLDAKTAVKTANQLYTSMAKLPAEERMDYLIKSTSGVATEEAANTTPKSQKEIAGQKCDLYDIENFGEVCLWNGIAIYSTIKVPTEGVEYTTTATTIETGVQVPDSVFEIPADIKIQNAQQ
jgi:hypothetical protein